MAGKILTRIADCLDDLTHKLFPHPKMPEGEPVCNVSPFNLQCNARDIEYARMQRNGATPEQLREYVRANPITTTEGQWRVPDRFPTHEENLEINAQLLDKKYA
jgi:hypothetical protein